jgi:prepilin signal peptidase PulO-like enzyme (type II secretory pathway)
VSRSSSLFCLKVSEARVSQSGIKTGRGVVWMVQVASSWKLRGDEVEDGRVDVMDCIRHFYPNFVVFTILGPKGISIFWLEL